MVTKKASWCQFFFFLEASRKSEAQVPTILKRQVVNKHLETVT